MVHGAGMWYVVRGAGMGMAKNPMWYVVQGWVWKGRSQTVRACRVKSMTAMV